MCTLTQSTMMNKDPIYMHLHISFCFKICHFLNDICVLHETEHNKRDLKKLIKILHRTGLMIILWKLKESLPIVLIKQIPT